MEIATYNTGAENDVALTLDYEKLSRHLLVLGRTGTGKSTLNEKVVLDAVEQGESVIFIDPHGTSAMRILERIPKIRYQRVCYLDAADPTPVGFNPLSNISYDEQFVVAAAITRGIRHIFGKSWGDRLNWFTLRSVHLAIEHNRTIADVSRVLANETFRNRLTEHIRDPSLNQFWNEEFAGHKERYIDEAKGPLFNKIGQFVASPHIRAIMMQERPMLDLRRVMDEGRILIVNLNKGHIGAEQASILGSIIVAMINYHAMRRSEDAHPCRLVIDEFKNVGSDIFDDMVSEVRKFRVSLTLAAQFLDQIDENVQHSLIANVGSIFCFGVGPTDAQNLSPALGVRADTLVQQHPFQAWARIYPNVTPFAVTTLPPSPPLAPASALIEQSRRHYGRDVTRHASPSRPRTTTKVRRAFKLKP